MKAVFATTQLVRAIKIEPMRNMSASSIATANS
jgi:hypothetical protein